VLFLIFVGFWEEVI